MRVWKEVHTASDLEIKISDIGAPSQEVKDLCAIYGRKKYEETKDTIDFDASGLIAAKCNEDCLIEATSSLEYKRCMEAGLPVDDECMSTCLRYCEGSCERKCSEIRDGEDGFRAQCAEADRDCRTACSQEFDISACMDACDDANNTCMGDMMDACTEPCKELCPTQCAESCAPDVHSECIKAPALKCTVSCIGAARYQYELFLVDKYTKECIAASSLQYRHLLGGIVEIELLRPVIHCEQRPNTFKGYKATRSTSDRNTGLVDNVYLEPKFYRPYFDIVGDNIRIYYRRNFSDSSV